MRLLRAATVADASAVVELTQVTYRSNHAATGLYGYVYEETTDSLIKSLYADVWRILVLEEAHRLVAAVRVRWDNPDYLWLARLAVHPDVQGQGVGRWLVQAVEIMAQRWGRKAVHLGAMESSPRNRALYERLGYQIFDRRETRHAPGHYYHVLKKIIPAADVNLTVNYYEQIADDYEQRHAKTERWSTEPMDRFTAVLKPATRILDLGCGPGKQSALLLEHGFDVVALDATWAMLQKVPVAQKAQADLRALPLSDASFEAVWASASLLHLPHQELVLALLELYRIIKPDGVCFVSLKQGDSEGLINGRWFAFYQPQQVKHALEGAGFTVLEQWVSQDLRPDNPPWIITIARRELGLPLVPVSH